MTVEAYPTGIRRKLTWLNVARFFRSKPARDLICINVQARPVGNIRSPADEAPTVVARLAGMNGCAMKRRTFLLAYAGAAVVALTGCAARPDTLAPDEFGRLANAIMPGTEEDPRANIGDHVFFDKESAVITAEALTTLQRQARWLVSYPYISVTIEGHCDERGTREFNLALGYRRAYAVREFLIAAGVDGRRISTISFGKERPEVVGSTEAAWAQNRRALTMVDGPAIAGQ